MDSNDFRYLIKFFEALAAIAGFITWRKWKHSYWRMFPIYLAVITICEFVGHFLARAVMYKEQEVLYDFVIPLEILFFCWLFYQYLPKRKWISIAGATIFIISLIIEHTVVTKEDDYFRSISYSVGVVVILLLTVAFFIHFFSSDEILLFRKNIMFWVSVGLIVFYLGTFPFYALYNYYSKKDEAFIDAYIWAIIFTNYGMYLLFTIGFIWGKPNYAYSSSSSTSSS